MGEIKKNILFLILPFRSHHIASFTYANFLKKQGGCTIVYAGVDTLKDFVERQGFQFHSIEYLFEYKIPNAKSFLAFLLASLVDTASGKRNYRQFYAAYFECKKLVNTYRPTEVYIDEGFSEYYWFFKESSASIKFINPNLSTSKAQGVPPLNSAFMPRDNWWSVTICEWLWFRNLIKLKGKELIFHLAFLGHDEIFFWKRFCNKRGWDWKLNIDWNHSFYRCVKNIETIILAPALLEFKSKTKLIHEKHFHQGIVRNEEEFITEVYLKLLKEIEVKRENPKFRVIYFSLGTQSELNRETEFYFTQKLLEFIASEPDFLLVMSKNEGMWQKFNNEKVRIFPFIPNLHFLQYTDLVISHGGLGTIKECMDARVPMIIYPLNVNTDQVSNARRIEYLGLGLAGNFKTATVNSIQKKIYTIFNSKSKFYKQHEHKVMPVQSQYAY